MEPTIASSRVKFGIRGTFCLRSWLCGAGADRMVAASAVFSESGGTNFIVVEAAKGVCNV